MSTQSTFQRTPSESLQLGLSLHQSGHLPEAEVCYRDILRQEPQHADALHLLGVIAQQRGQYDAAIPLIVAAIQQNPQVANYHNNLGNTYQLTGEPDAAIACYCVALALDPQHFDALHSLANVLVEQNQLSEAESCFLRLLAIQPDHAEARYNFANAKMKLRDLRGAIENYRHAVRLRPDCFQFHYNLGCALQETGALADAALAFGHATRLDPDDAEAHNQHGIVLQEQGDFSAATAAFRRVLALQPDFAEALCNLAICLQHDEDFPAAANLLRRAIALNPSLAEAHSNLGGNLWRQGDLQGAIDACRRAISLNPGLPEAHSNLGHALSDSGKLEDAMDNYRRALALKPDSAKFLHYIGLTYLLRGEFAVGWQYYENRWQTKALVGSQRNFTQPLWRGQLLLGARILLHAEQGLGDTLQFVRYVPLVAARGATVILETPHELRRLLCCVPGASEIVTRGDALPDFAWHCPLLSLPLAFHTDLATIPANIPYLHADSVEVRKWSQQLARDTLRVGLVWAGNAIHTRDPQRSIPLAQFEPLAQLPGVTLYSLQKGRAASQLRHFSAKTTLTDLAPQLHDFADTAALLSSLDLLISVDTATAHLAGALGKPVWILLTHVPDWRWLLHRDDSPWYPTARLFRQPAAGDWASVISRMAAELQQLAPAPSQTLRDLGGPVNR